jgi:hypothetical protein
MFAAIKSGASSLDIGRTNRPSTTPARLTRAKCRLGERFGLRLRRKDGSLNRCGTQHAQSIKNHATTILT